MSNIRKSFSFRDGIQVDSDDLVVRGNLVGIGTTIPTQRLDVRGDVKIVGLVTTNNVFVTGIGTFSKVAIGTSISITGGLVTATAFYGDGATLSNLPTSQWVDVDVGLGFTSIYAAGNVGIATLDPRNTFQIGSDPNEENRQGVGFNSTGDMILSGVVTAGYYYGDARHLTGITAENIEFGTISNSKLPILAENRFPTNLTLAGILTAQGGFIGTVTGRVVGDLVGIASFAYGLTNVPDIQVGVISATKIRTDTIEVLATPNAGVSTVAFKFQVGVGGTGFTATDGGRIGVGTGDPQADIQVLKTTKDEVTTVEILNVPGESRIAIGNSVGIGNSIGIIRYGNTPGAFDFVNKSTGGLNFYTHSGNAGFNTAGFTWIYGQSNATLATLSWDGNFGIGKTNPSQKLDVNGNAFISQNLNVLGNAVVIGSLTYGSGANQVTLGGGGDPILGGVNVNAVSGISTFSEVHINGSSVLGIGTNNPLDGIGLDARPATALFAAVGIATTSVSEALSVRGNGSISGNLGIATDSLFPGYTTPDGLNVSTDGLQIHKNIIVFDGDVLLLGRGTSPGGGIGLGTGAPFAALDMRAAKYNNVRSVFYPPILRTETEKWALRQGTTLGTGAFIHDLNAFSPEFYTEDFGWQPAGFVGYDNVIVGNRNNTWQNYTRTAQNLDPIGAGATGNTLVGSTVGTALTAGSKYNTMIGDRSGFALTGNYNTCIGFKVGGDPNPGNTPKSYKHVVLLGCGDGSGRTQSDTEDPAPPGGWSEGYHPETGAFVPPIQGSRVLGIGVNDFGTNKYWITGNSNMNVGIGVSNASSKLSVGGSLFVSSGIATFASGSHSSNIKIGITGSNEIDTSSGNLTIDSAGGTVTIDDNLSVSGNYTSTNGNITLTNGNLTLTNGALSVGGNLTSTAGALSVNGNITSIAGTTLTLGDLETKITSSSYTAATTNFTFDTWSATTYSLARYTLHIVQGTDQQIEEFLVGTDGSTAQISLIAQQIFGTKISVQVVDVSAGNVRVRFDPEPLQTGTTTYKFVRQLLV